ncbi:MFS transporter [Companilactobacillus huachuanensis]|uniref:MFS transporter n=1 Tax=Companilactobacillus huachuanensis TaxID=2559914 RepID=A0ABW1RQL1_9LACO|nr:MFS transporter [Companilactobacillus huachuanensis]
MHKNQRIFLILLTAMNLRLSVTAITPLFTAIQKTLNVDSTITALLVTIPLLCFSIGAVITPWLNQRFGLRPLLIFTNGLLILANILRPINVAFLLVGTLLIGIAISLLNVLVPVMISQTTHETSEITKLTSYYSVIMNILAAIATATAIPLANLFGWANVLRGFAIPVLLTFIASLLLTPFPKSAAVENPQKLLKTLLHDKAAQKLTIFMGLQSLIFYSLISWLPAIYQSLGATSSEAGMLLSIFQFVGIPAAIALNYLTDTKKLFIILATGYSLGMITIFWHGIGWWLSAIILGFTAALIFSVALNLIATSSTQVTKIANRSALAQSLGYLLAATGPVILGRLHDSFHSWSVVLIMLIILMGLTILAGVRVVNHQK